PVRSLRPYFVDWTMGYDAAVAHVGGSPQALEMAKQLHIKDLDQFKYPAPYYRSSSRQAPHNVYVKMDKLLAQAQELGFGTSNFVGYPRKDDNPVTNPSATDIIVNYSSQDYQGEFRYQASSNTYIRYLAAQQQVDQATGQPIQIKNVVVIKMSGQQVNANSSGDAVVFYDGRAIQANWQKDSHSDYLHVYDSNGNALQLNRGSTWFAVLPKGQVLTY
ncbi:MAG: DUF3048 C-terminal domain-containing protein, partial [Candidatus Saccharimonadales bacterium]